MLVWLYVWLYGCKGLRLRLSDQQLRYASTDMIFCGCGSGQGAMTDALFLIDSLASLESVCCRRSSPAALPIDRSICLPLESTGG